MVQAALAVSRTRGILRRCAPQDDNNFVILSGTKWSEESRACALPYRATPPGWQGPSRRSEQGGRGGCAMRAPMGWHLAPSCCFGKWVAAAKRDNAFTREARSEGKGVDSQEGENRRCSPSCAQCGRAGRALARWERVRLSPCRANTQGWRAEVAEPEETARRGRGPGQLLLALRPNSPSRALRGGFPPKGRSVDLTGPLRQRLTALPPPLKGEAGWVCAGGVSRSRARARSFAPLRFAQNDKGESASADAALGAGGFRPPCKARFFTPSAAFLQ